MWKTVDRIKTHQVAKQDEVMNRLRSGASIPIYRWRQYTPTNAPWSIFFFLGGGMNKKFNITHTSLFKMAA